MSNDIKLFQPSPLQHGREDRPGSCRGRELCRYPFSRLKEFGEIACTNAVDEKISGFLDKKATLTLRTFINYFLLVGYLNGLQPVSRWLPDRG